MKLQEDARRYVTALNSPPTAWGVHMVRFEQTNRQGIPVELKSTSDDWRDYMGRRYGVQETDEAIQEALEQSFTHRGKTWFYGEIFEDAEEKTK